MNTFTSHDYIALPGQLADVLLMIPMHMEDLIKHIINFMSSSVGGVQLATSMALIQKIMAVLNSRI